MAPSATPADPNVQRLRVVNAPQSFYRTISAAADFGYGLLQNVTGRNRGPRSTTSGLGDGLGAPNRRGLNGASHRSRPGEPFRRKKMARISEGGGEKDERSHPRALPFPRHGEDEKGD